MQLTMQEAELMIMQRNIGTYPGVSEMYKHWNVFQMLLTKDGETWGRIPVFRDVSQGLGTYPTD